MPSAINLLLLMTGFKLPMISCIASLGTPYRELTPQPKSMLFT